MKKQSRIKILFSQSALLPVLFFLMGIGGCKVNLSGLPDFSVTGPVCNIHEVCFDFYNSAASEIKKIEIRMNVYDKKTGSPALKNAVTVECAFDCSLMPFENQQFYASVDEYISGVQSVELIIDNFYVSRVLYSNGRVWKDLFGFYSQFYSH